MRALRLSFLGMTAVLCAGVGSVWVSASATPQRSDETGSRHFSAALSGAEEVPAISSRGYGEARVEIDDANQLIHYELAFNELDGAVSMSHIHLAQPGASGGIMVWFCKTTQSAPAGTPDCPAPGQSVSGTVGASGVVGPASQRIAPGEFEEVAAAIRAGLAYVNVHTAAVPGGEIRGQLRPGRGHQ